MSTKQKTYIIMVYGILGIAASIVVLFALDMVIMHGEYLAHHFKRQQPDCGGQCHASRSYYRPHDFKRFAELRKTHG